MSKEDEIEKIKCLSVGDNDSDKSNVLITYTTDPNDESSKTVFDNYQKSVEYNGKKFILCLWDTSGDDDYDRLRPMSYPDTNVVLAFFSLVHPYTLKRLESKFIPEARDHLQNVPIVLIGTKKELRDDEKTLEKLKNDGKEPISTEEGELFAKKMKLQDYVEVSSDDVENAFETVTKVLFELPKKMKKKKKDGKGGCFVM